MFMNKNKSRPKALVVGASSGRMPFLVLLFFAQDDVSKRLLNICMVQTWKQLSRTEMFPR